MGSREHHSHSKGKKAGALLKEQLELVKVKRADGVSRYTIRAIDDSLTFDKGFYVFVRALQMLKSSNEGAIIVGLAGPSGSGKTAFSSKIQSFMQGVAVISMDMYNQGDKVVDDNFDDPRLTDYETLLSNIKDLQSGKPAQIPIYDFKQSKRVGYREQEVPSSRIIIIEGIYSLSYKLRPFLDLRVSITGGVHFDLVKRVMRDIERSGQRAEQVVQQITDTVYPMYKAYIEPDLQTAQLQVINSFNPFSGFMNASHILKSAKVPSSEQIIAALGGEVKEEDELEIYDIYLLPPNEDPETCQSWLRMRNRDGRYSLMFEEWVTEGPYIISPRISFEVNVRLLGGLMSLGYEIGAIMRRASRVFKGSEVTVKLDDIQNLGEFVAILGKDRAQVGEVGSKLGLDGTYIARSYIEQVQLEELTQEFSNVSEDWKRRFAAGGDGAMLEDLVNSSSPPIVRGHCDNDAHRMGKTSSSAPISSFMANAALKEGTSTPVGQAPRAASNGTPCVKVPQHLMGLGSDRASSPHLHGSLASSAGMAVQLNGEGSRADLSSEKALFNGECEWGFSTPGGPDNDGPHAPRLLRRPPSSTSVLSVALSKSRRNSYNNLQATCIAPLGNEGQGGGASVPVALHQLENQIRQLATMVKESSGHQMQLDVLTELMRSTHEQLDVLAGQTRSTNEQLTKLAEVMTSLAAIAASSSVLPSAQTTQPPPSHMTQMASYMVLGAMGAAAGALMASFILRSDR